MRLSKAQWMHMRATTRLLRLLPCSHSHRDWCSGHTAIQHAHGSRPPTCTKYTLHLIFRTRTITATSYQPPLTARSLADAGLRVSRPAHCQHKPCLLRNVHIPTSHITQRSAFLRRCQPQLVAPAPHCERRLQLTCRARSWLSRCTRRCALHPAWRLPETR